jgi:hypothetical protein
MQFTAPWILPCNIFCILCALEQENPINRLGGYYDYDGIYGSFRLRDDLRAMRKGSDRPRTVRVREREARPPYLALHQL